MLQSLHPGQSVADIEAATGFDFDIASDVAETAPPDAATLALIRGSVGREIAATYPAFARDSLGVAA